MPDTHFPAIGHNGPPADPRGPSQTKARKHVTPEEAARVFSAAGQSGRNGLRDRALVLVMYWHGLRCSEALSWQWSDIDWTTKRVHVGRLKRGREGTHPINGQTLRALRALKQEMGKVDGHIFVSERGFRLSPDMAARVVTRAGEVACLGFHLHPHMLRHGCGFMLANKKTDTRTIQDYLGHADIRSTVVYTDLAADKFEGLIAD